MTVFDFLFLFIFPTVEVPRHRIESRDRPRVETRLASIREDVYPLYDQTAQFEYVYY